MKKSTFLIVGRHAVVEALKNPLRKIERIFLTEDAQKKLNRENQELNLFKKINVFFKSRKELDNLCGRDETAHQGLVAEVEQLEEITLKEFIIENTNNNINLIALQEVTDPRNIGAIIRSAVAFNIDGIISDNRYGFYSKTKKSIFITHQLEIQSPFFQNLIQKINYKYINKFSECWILDFKESSIAGALSNPKKKTKNQKFWRAPFQLYQNLR